jgi:hypothetical protein
VCCPRGCGQKATGFYKWWSEVLRILRVQLMVLLSKSILIRKAIIKFDWIRIGWN